MKKSNNGLLVAFGIISLLVILVLFYVINQNQKNNEELLSQIKNLQNENSQLKSQSSVLQSSANSLKKQVDDLQKELVSKNKEIKYLSDYTDCLVNYTNYKYVSERIIVGFEDNVTKSEAQNIILGLGLEIEHQYTYINYAVVIVPVDEATEWVCKLPLFSGIKNAHFDEPISAN